MGNPIQQRYEALAEQAESTLSALRRPSHIFIQIGSATCEHAAGSREVESEFRKHIEASGRKDIILRRTGCTGRCSREPIVGVFMPDGMPTKYEQVGRDAVHKIFTSHIQGGIPVTELVLDASEDEQVHKYDLLFCRGARCGRNLDFNVQDAFRDAISTGDLTPGAVRILDANCFGLCTRGEGGHTTHVLVRPSKVIYRVDSQDDVDEIVQEHLQGGRTVERLRVSSAPMTQRFFDRYGDVAFFSRQSRIALRNAGVVDPESIDEYTHYRGFLGLSKVLSNDNPEWVISELLTAKLRGRGGGGFPTGKKWAAARTSEETTRYIICNADEGDPGAFMDRSMLESDPFNVIEGMIIGGFAIGASRGFIYLRAEYPLAIKRIEHAIAECRQRGLLGKDVMGSGFSFDLEVRLGAGAFVCGEETALIHSIEGQRGQPHIRPPYPSEKGLWGKPTVINNVETFANIPAIIVYGGEWFSQLGSETSGGTKVFALAGKVHHTGLVEVPMGTTLREVVFTIGGGVPNGKTFKAVQTGGPAGGCIPAEFLDTVVDFDTLAQLGSIMGSGGMIVLDEDDCMVDVAKFFITFSEDESCGKCTPCREGTKRMFELLERLTNGNGTLEDIDRLERLALLVKKASLCGLGRAAPNPVISTLKYFREEYEAHVVDKRCPARKCRSLVAYEIESETCVGCTLCARNCPASCISGERREAHVIDQSQCIKCGRCFEVCRFSAVTRQ